MWKFVKGIAESALSPITDIIGEAVTDKDERNKLVQQIKMAIINAAQSEMEAKKDIIVAEAQSESWLTQSWRPITMIVFLVLLLTYWFGLTAEYVVASEDVVQEVFQLLKIGIGGYIGSRGAEKVSENYFKGKKEEL